MSDGLNELTNEKSLLRWLGNPGWKVYGGENHHGSGGALINDEYGRDVNEPVLWSLVQDQVIKLNPKVTEKNVECHFGDQK